MGIFNSFTIDGVNSLDYGVYISAGGAYDAPMRAVEVVNIPGKDGALLLDQGRFDNVTVKYPAGCFANSKEEFAAKIATFRSLLASKYEYVRLTDTYNPDEFRLASFRSGMSVSPKVYNRAGEFEIEFDCKPQRFLISGESPYPLAGDYQTLQDENSVALANESGVEIEAATTETDKIINPTDFPSKPMIRITGPGTVSIGDFIITVSDISATTTVYIDCETMEIYTMSGGIKMPAYSRVAFNTGEFPTIPPGESGLSHTTTVVIIPKWWRI